MSVRHTKIVCTLGPASSGRVVLADMIRSGMDVARVNMSHGTHTSHARTIRLVRSLAEQLGRTVGIMADLQGPKLRTGVMQAGGVDLQEGASITLDLSREPGTESRIPIQAEEFFGMVAQGDRFVIDDGLLELAVLDIAGSVMRAEVIHGGLLRDNKGINLLNDRAAVSPLTDKDRVDLAFAVQQEADWIALSFVQGPENVSEVKGLMYGLLPTGAMPIPVMSKIEKPGAVTAIDDIMELSDGIMVARGDLGIETGPERVPLIQKDLIRRCNLAGMPVVTATQMLESMIHNPRPSRAEASDVANAVIDGTDCIMLSGETAMGRDPAHVIRTMASIVTAVEDEFATPPLRSKNDADESRGRHCRLRCPVHGPPGGCGGRLRHSDPHGLRRHGQEPVPLPPGRADRRPHTQPAGAQHADGPPRHPESADRGLRHIGRGDSGCHRPRPGFRPRGGRGPGRNHRGHGHRPVRHDQHDHRQKRQPPPVQGVGQGSKRVMGSCVQVAEILQNGIVDPQDCILVAPEFTPECIEFASRSLGLITGCSAEAVAAMLPEGRTQDWLAIYGAVGDFSRAAECRTLIMDTITGRVFDLAQIRNI